MKVVFQNPGVIDKRFIQYVGVSAKEGSNPIGMFGTGLKYAIAVLTREDQHIAIMAGDELLTFDTATEEMRGKAFDVLQMHVLSGNGHGTVVPLPFPTEYGKKWELWQAFRELYCNCVDEGGCVFALEDDEDPTHNEHMTTIVVEGEEFFDVFRLKDQIILSRDVIYENPICSIHGGDNKSVFYRGVRVCDLKNGSHFTYNIHNKIDLTEDRTIKYDWEMKQTIVAGIYQMPVGHDLETILTAQSGLEKELNFDCGLPPGNDFLDMVGQLRLRKYEMLNKSALQVFERYRKKFLSEEDSIELTKMETIMLEKAKRFLKDQLACHALDEYKVVVVDMNENTLGCVYNNLIFLNRHAFRFGGTKLVTSTLLEEYLHIHKGWEDFDRNMQNYLFDTVISLGEQLQGEPL